MSRSSTKSNSCRCTATRLRSSVATPRFAGIRKFEVVAPTSFCPSDAGIMFLPLERVPYNFRVGDGPVVAALRLEPKCQMHRLHGQPVILQAETNPPVWTARRAYGICADASPLRFRGFHARSPRKYCQRPCNRQIICNCRYGKCSKKQ
jgi:hypothetical protein